MVSCLEEKWTLKDKAQSLLNYFTKYYTKKPECIHLRGAAVKKPEPW